MTKDESRKFRRLELLVEELQAAHKKDMQIYVEQSTEIIELRHRLAYLEEIAREMVAVIDGPGM